MAVFLDTNVLVYCFDESEPENSEDMERGRMFGGLEVVNLFA